MGCPDNQVVKLGGGAALMQDAKLATKIIHTTQKATKLPVSVKTRLGFNSIDFDFIRAIADTKPSAITIHARTKKELSLVPAHWSVLAEIVPELKERGIIVLGNGDVKNYADVLQKIKESGVDGVMIGRGVFGNPWVFSPLETARPSPLGAQARAEVLTGFANRLKVLLRHAELFEESFGTRKNFNMLKKHIHGYIHGFDGAKEMRNRIMETRTIEQMKNTLREMTNNK
jgi:tRNA-dihydrouridine synthase